MWYRKATLGLAGLTLATVIAPWMLVHAERSTDQERKNSDAVIERKKEKGLPGVDFSYDLFGGPPGQSAVRSAEEAIAKDREDKPKVMAAQARRLQDRYRLECNTSSAARMTKGKPQPIGPTMKLHDGLTWDALARMAICIAGYEQWPLDDVWVQRNRTATISH